MDWKRNLDETQQGNVGDVRDKSRILDLVIQCKHMKKPSPLRALDEAQEAATTSKLYPEMGVACIQEHNGTKAVIMDPRLFAALLITADDWGQECGRSIEDRILDILDGGSIPRW
jgi:hypothetical protein